MWLRGEFELTTNAVHAIVNVIQEVRCVWHRVIVRGQTQSAVAGLLSCMICDARQKRIHLMTHAGLLTTLSFQ